LLAYLTGATPLPSPKRGALINLSRSAARRLELRVRAGDGSSRIIDVDLVRGDAAIARGSGSLPAGDPWSSVRRNDDGALGEYGRAFGASLFAGDVAQAIPDACSDLQLGESVEIVLATDTAEASLPLEVAILPDGRELALEPAVQLRRASPARGGASV